MKRIITLFSVFFSIAAGMTLNSHAQTISSVGHNDSCNYSGSQIMSFVNIAGPAGTNTCKVETNHGDGSKKDTTSVLINGTNFYSVLNHKYVTAGSYTVKHVLICSGNRVDSNSSSVSISCQYIGGLLYNDANSNCVYNAGEYLLNSITHIRVDSAGVAIDTISASGYWWYKIRATSATVYTFTVIGNPVGYVKTCPSTGSLTYSFTPSPFSITNQNFAFNCSATVTYDYGLSYSRALRGSGSTGASYIYLSAFNSTCQTGTGTVTLQVSPKYNITASGITPTPASVSGNTITWTIPNMTNSVIKLLYVPLTPLSTTSNGDTACNYATITTTGDANLSNNTVSICDSVRASWDPNEKSVYPNGPVSAGTTLTYTVDFENLGNDTAFNVHVQDTLSQYLDVSTFQLLTATHRVVPYIYEIAGGKRVIKFDFPNISLEDKTVPTRNKGQVRFTMKMMAGLPAGTVVENRAGIYFDGNPVVMTNTAYSKIGTPAGVQTMSNVSAIKVYPNPASDAITIRVEGAGWSEVTLANAIGQTVLRQSLTAGSNTLKVQSLPAGIYYLQAKGSAGTHTEKIEKQ